MDKLSSSSTNITAWFTSADETDAFFSLDSSNSGDSFRHLKPKTTAPKEAWPEHQLGSDHVSTQLYYSRRRRTRRKRRPSCYAVEKRSKDPRGDFRASMVEMIVEKQIFAAEDLERLLLSFLSLNNVSYHGIIFNVFTEICQTLFANS